MDEEGKLLTVMTQLLSLLKNEKLPKDLGKFL